MKMKVTKFQGGGGNLFYLKMYRMYIWLIVLIIK